MDYSVIGGIAILAILIFVIFMELRKSADKKAAGKFLEDLKDQIVNIVLDTINSGDPSKYKTLQEFEEALLENIYSNVWDFVSNKAQESSDTDIITKAIFKCISKDTVIKFIDAIIEKNDIVSLMVNNYGTNAIEQSNIEEEDKALEAEYSDQTQYIEESNADDLPAAEPESHTEEELSSINPQTDNEELFDVEDDSMEIITDKKEIITTTSKSGQTLYYEIDENGKKTRVSKEYALKNM